MTRSLSAVVFLMLLILLASCAITQTDVTPKAEHFFYIDLVILDPQGMVIAGCAIFSGDEVVAVPTGGVRLTVTRPIWVVAFKPGYSPSPRTWLEPGEREIVLEPLRKADE